MERKLNLLNLHKLVDTSKKWRLAMTIIGTLLCLVLKGEKCSSSSCVIVELHLAFIRKNQTKEDCSVLKTYILALLAVTVNIIQRLWRLNYLDVLAWRVSECEVAFYIVVSVTFLAFYNFTILLSSLMTFTGLWNSWQ